MNTKNTVNNGEFRDMYARTREAVKPLRLRHDYGMVTVRLRRGFATDTREIGQFNKSIIFHAVIDHEMAF